MATPPGARRYRTLPVEVEAIQFDPTDNAAVQALWEWAGDPPITPAEYNPDTNRFMSLRILTMEGPVYARPGDYIIRGWFGEFYPCRPGAFPAKYALLEEKT